jgi:hypothetical protein
VRASDGRAPFHSPSGTRDGRQYLRAESEPARPRGTGYRVGRDQEQSGLSPLLTTTASLAALALTTELLQATSATTTAGAPVVSPLFSLLTYLSRLGRWEEEEGVRHWLSAMGTVCWAGRCAVLNGCGRGLR